MILLPLILIITFVLVYVGRFYNTAFKFWEKQDVAVIKPTFFSSVKQIISQKVSPRDAIRLLYQTLDPHKFGVYYNFHQPQFMVRDPDLLKNILTKDFAYFPNHPTKLHKELEPMNINLFNLEGEEWRNLRIKLTSTFTTGKMKLMLPLMKSSALKLTKVLDELAENGEEFEAKELCGLYTIETIASCAFGLEPNVIEHPNSEFCQMVKRTLELKFKTMLRFMFPNMPTTIIKIFRLYMQDQDVSEYFRKIVDDTVRYREQNKVTRNDFLDLLISLRNNTELSKLRSQNDTEDLEKFLAQTGGKEMKSDVEMTVDLMASQCFGFFGAGFEGAASTITFALYELSVNKAIQTKVRDEVKAVVRRNGGEITYESLKEMVYLDMVMEETIRKYPLAIVVTRKCSKDYEVPDSSFVVKEGTTVIVPIIGLHYDKKYYERPEDFYPEHFTPEAKVERPHYSYLPFGEGPRICIGERFAKLQAKVGLIYLLLNYEYELSPKTTVPLQFQFTGLNKVKGGVWLRCKRKANK